MLCDICRRELRAGELVSELFPVGSDASGWYGHRDCLLLLLDELRARGGRYLGEWAL